MEIEVVTTKKKLSKSLVNQMPNATLDVLKSGLVLGYVVDIVKTQRKTIIIKHKEEYYTVSMGWEKDSYGVFRQVGRYKERLKPEISDEWWRWYQRVLGAADIHIYI